MVLESGKKFLENQLNGGRDVLSSMAAEAATDSSLLLKRQDRLAVDCATNAVVTLPMSASLVFYVCVVLCVVCCVLCAVYCVSCVVCRVLFDVCLWVLCCVCLCHGCRRGSSGYTTNQQCGSSHQELECPPRRLQAHVEEDADAHLLAACKPGRHSWAELLTDRGLCASMLRVLFRICSESLTILNNSQQIMNTF